VTIQNRELIPGWAPPNAPFSWTRVERGADGGKYRHDLSGQTVIISASIEDDGRAWLHFSTAFAHRLPTWPEFVSTKEKFLGAEVKAIQIIPPRAEYVNIHPYVLHAFVCLDGDPLPDFTRGSGSL